MIRAISQMNGMGWQNGDNDKCGEIKLASELDDNVDMREFDDIFHDLMGPEFENDGGDDNMVINQKILAGNMKQDATLTNLTENEDLYVEGEDQNNPRTGIYSDIVRSDADDSVEYVLDDDINTNNINGKIKVASKNNNKLIDESNFQLWCQKNVLLWLKLQLLENGFQKRVGLRFLKEFATKQVTVMH